MEGVEVKLHGLVTSALDKREPISGSGRITLRKTTVSIG
jgi:hypothetical protein